MPLKDITGQRFGRLVVISLDSTRNRKSYWKCICDCGNIVIARSDGLKCGDYVSCGCYAKERSAEQGRKNATHGKSRTPAYAVYKQMKQRCLNPKHRFFRNYGGRGIVVCARWLDSYENFISDMGERPDGMTIERVNNSGSYSPDNCQWVSMVTQGNNRRTNVLWSLNGEEKTIAQWAREIGIPTSTLHARVAKLSWSIKKALTTPLNSPGVGI